MDIRKVKKLIELLDDSGIAEIEITEGEESVRISRYPAGIPVAAAPLAAPAPVAAPAPAAAPAEAPAEAKEEDGFEVIAPVTRVGIGAIEAAAISTAPARIGQVVARREDRVPVQTKKALERFGAYAMGAGMNEDFGRFVRHG